MSLEMINSSTMMNIFKSLAILVVLGEYSNINIEYEPYIYMIEPEFLSKKE